jgi:membrane protein DedA with SNARE-associated domain
MGTLLSIIALICAIYVIADVWTKQAAMGTGEKAIWTVAAILFSIITAIIYYIARKS